VRDCAFRDPVGNMVRFNQPLAPDQVPAMPTDWQS